MFALLFVPLSEGMRDSNLLHGVLRGPLFSFVFVFGCLCVCVLVVLFSLPFCVWSVCCVPPAFWRSSFLSLVVCTLLCLVLGVRCSLLRSLCCFAFRCGMRFLWCVFFILKWCGAKSRSPQCIDTQVCSPADTVFVLTGFCSSPLFVLSLHLRAHCSLPIDH